MTHPPAEGDWFLVRRPDGDTDIGCILEHNREAMYHVFYPQIPDTEWVLKQELLEYLGDVSDTCFNEAYDRAYNR